MQTMSRFFVYLICGIVLAGCTTLAPHASSPATSWAKRQAALLRIAHWKSIGTVGLRTPQAAWSANFHWQQQPTDYHLQLFAPLGAGSITLTGNDKTVKLLTSKGEHYQAATTQDLLFERTGWYLPVEWLRYWIKGIPAPKQSAQLKFDNRQRLIQLAQQGWIINYQKYQMVNGIELPSLINLKNDDFTIRISVKQWSIE
jgi:outer membrane lipoprotein LolB